MARGPAGRQGVQDGMAGRVKGMRTRVGRAALWGVAALVTLGVGVGLGAVSPPASPVMPPPGALRGGYSPAIVPSNFVGAIDNRYFPLAPGTTFHYRGYSGATPQTDDMTVTHRTKTILGVRSVVVRDTVTEHGVPVERTFDWYAQDVRGNVWYMGEDSLERRNGRLVRADDSWQAGVDGAKPGIIMRGTPRPGDVY